LGWCEGVPGGLVVIEGVGGRSRAAGRPAERTLEGPDRWRRTLDGPPILWEGGLCLCKSRILSHPRT
jgi:hypothetical protein